MEIALKYKRMFTDMSVGTLKLSPSSYILAHICRLDEGFHPVRFTISMNSPVGVDQIGSGSAPSPANAKKQINNIVEEWMITQSTRGIV
jgi:hypothetical protein